MDLASSEARVVVEYEGEHHVDACRPASDDVRLRRLVAAGWTVIRLPAADPRSTEDAVERIAESLGVVPRCT